MNFEIAPKETEIYALWEDAKLYCFALNIDGKTGWRLPSKEELNAIYHSANDFEKFIYLSSTENLDIYMWSQNFFNGVQIHNALRNQHKLYVRAIRDL